MGYSSNKKFSATSDMIGVVIDGCGNTYEDKYYVNGAYIDLCGLPVEEYMNNPCCGNCGGDSDSDLPDGKKKNVIKVEAYEQDGYIYYRAIATYPVASVLKIRVVSSGDGNVTELDIFPGDTESKPEIGDTINIATVSINVTEDDYFQYIPTNGNETPDEVTHIIYTATLHIDDIKNLTGDSIENLQPLTMETGTTVDINFTIPGTDVNYYDIETDEFEEFCKNNQYGFVLAIPKKIYDNKSYNIINYGGSDVSYKFVLDSAHETSLGEYVCLVEKATDDIMPYVPFYKEDINYEYKLTLTK